LLAKGTEYAIRALVYVRLPNREKKRPGVQEIAREIEAPVAYSAKILQTLTKHHYVEILRIYESRRSRQIEIRTMTYT